MHHSDCQRGCVLSISQLKFCVLSQDLSQALEKMNQAMAFLLSGGRKITNKEKAAQDSLMLHQKIENIMKQFKDRQTSLENHLEQWQR